MHDMLREIKIKDYTSRCLTACKPILNNCIMYAYSTSALTEISADCEQAIQQVNNSAKEDNLFFYPLLLVEAFEPVELRFVVRHKDIKVTKIDPSIEFK